MAQSNNKIFIRIIFCTLIIQFWSCSFYTPTQAEAEEFIEASEAEKEFMEHVFEAFNRRYERQILSSAEEQPWIRAPASDASCALENFLQLGVSKYYYSPTPMSWEDALDECKNAGLQMATISSSAENNKLGLRLMQAFIELTKPRNQKIWIGATDTDQKGIFEWESGLAMTYVNNYGGPQLDLDVGKHICLRVGFSAEGSNALQWKQDDCNKSLEFLCETETRECYEDDLMSYGPALIKIFGTKYFLSLEKLNWEDALEFCESQDLRLISLHSPAINDEIGGILGRKNQLLADFSFWTSGSHHILDYNDGKPMWMTNGIISDGKWNPWAIDEPSDQEYFNPKKRCKGRMEMCIEARLLPGGRIEWAASDCMIPKPFVCAKLSACQSKSGVDITKSNDPDLHEENVKVKITQSGGPVERELAFGKNDNEGYYFSFSGRLYFISLDSYHWRGALKACSNRGMNMYTPETDLQHFAIAEFLWNQRTNDTKCNYWMGGVDLGSPFKYYWIDSGTPIPDKPFFIKDIEADARLPTCMYFQLCDENLPTVKQFKWRVQSCSDPEFFKPSYMCEQKKC